MTDSFKGLTVTFGRDIREDDVEHIINAIKMIKGVIDVIPSVATGEDIMNRIRIEREVEDKIWYALKNYKN